MLCRRQVGESDPSSSSSHSAAESWSSRARCRRAETASSRVASSSSTGKLGVRFRPPDGRLFEQFWGRARAAAAASTVLHFRSMPASNIRTVFFCSRYFCSRVAAPPADDVFLLRPFAGRQGCLFLALWQASLLALKRLPESCPTNSTRAYFLPSHPNPLLNRSQ